MPDLTPDPTNKLDISATTAGKKVRSGSGRIVNPPKRLKPNLGRATESYADSQTPFFASTGAPAVMADDTNMQAATTAITRKKMTQLELSTLMGYISAGLERDFTEAIKKFDLNDLSGLKLKFDARNKSASTLLHHILIQFKDSFVPMAINNGARADLLCLQMLIRGSVDAVAMRALLQSLFVQGISIPEHIKASLEARKSLPQRDDLLDAIEKHNAELLNSYKDTEAAAAPVTAAAAATEDAPVNAAAAITAAPVTTTDVNIDTVKRDAANLLGFADAAKKPEATKKTKRRSIIRMPGVTLQTPVPVIIKASTTATVTAPTATENSRRTPSPDSAFTINPTVINKYKSAVNAQFKNYASEFEFFLLSLSSLQAEMQNFVKTIRNLYAAHNQLWQSIKNLQKFENPAATDDQQQLMLFFNSISNIDSNNLISLQLRTRQWIAAFAEDLNADLAIINRHLNTAAKPQAQYGLINQRLSTSTATNPPNISFVDFYKYKLELVQYVAQNYNLTVCHFNNLQTCLLDLMPRMSTYRILIKNISQSELDLASEVALLPMRQTTDGDNTAIFKRVFPDLAEQDLDYKTRRNELLGVLQQNLFDASQEINKLVTQFNQMQTQPTVYSPTLYLPLYNQQQQQYNQMQQAAALSSSSSSSIAASYRMPF